MPSPTSPTERGAPEDSSSSPASSRSGNGSDAVPPAPEEALGDALRRVGELKAYAAHFVAAKLDALKVTGRNIAVYAVLGVIGVLTAGTLVITAVVLAMRGLAEAIAAALGGRQWAGDLIVGFGFVLLLGLGVWIGMKILFKSLRQGTEKKYESKRRIQQAEFGHDVHDRARDQERLERQRR
jgi:hypothetical protein